MDKDNNIYHYDDEIELKDLFKIIWRKKIFIACITSLFSVFSVIYSLHLPNTYTSSTLLSPTSQDESLSSSLGGLSGLASFAGVSIPSGNITKSQIAVKRIQSHEFFSQHFLPNIKLENLMAVQEWDPNSNSILYNKKFFDTKSQSWIRTVSFPKSTKPSSQEAFKEYQKILNIEESKETGLVYISIKHQSPYIAKNWIDIIVYSINESMRSIDMKDAQNSIDFLNQSASNVKIQSIKEVISKLLESQMQTLMLASSNKDYIFKIINSSVVPEEKTGPNRALICIMGTLIGAFVSIIMSFIQYFRQFEQK